MCIVYTYIHVFRFCGERVVFFFFLFMYIETSCNVQMAFIWAGFSNQRFIMSLFQTQPAIAKIRCLMKEKPDMVREITAITSVRK